MNKPRRHFSGPEKVAILKRHLLEKVPVSDLCDELGIAPNLFYRWQKEFFDNGHAAFDNDRKSRAVEDAKDKKIELLEAKLQRKNEVPRRTHGGARPAKKRTWGTLTGCWVPHDTRDQVVDFVRAWADKTDIPVCRFLPWIGVGASKFHDWKRRFGKVNEHNAWVPRDHWLTEPEKEAVRLFARQHPLEGYRRQTFMMLDADVVACSPASVYRVLKAAGLLAGQTPTPTKKGTGFVQPLRPHEHWHVDVSYLNVAGHLLLPLLRPRRLQPIHRPLGNPRQNGGIRRANHHPTRPRKGSRPDAADHLRQRAAIHRQGLQGVHPRLRHDPRQDLRPITPKATAKSNAGTRPSRAIASAC